MPPKENQGRSWQVQKGGCFGGLRREEGWGVWCPGAVWSWSKKQEALGLRRVQRWRSGDRHPCQNSWAFIEHDLVKKAGAYRHLWGGLVDAQELPLPLCVDNVTRGVRYLPHFLFHAQQHVFTAGETNIHSTHFQSQLVKGSERRIRKLI